MLTVRLKEKNWSAAKESSRLVLMNGIGNAAVSQVPAQDGGTGKN